MNTNSDNIQDSLNLIATAVSTLKQLSTFPTAQITQIKEHYFLRKLVTLNILFEPK